MIINHEDFLWPFGGCYSVVAVQLPLLLCCSIKRSRISAVDILHSTALYRYGTAKN
eukprot:SAG11_NODE_27400_length_333_cov_0.666667_1_plen_55_part_01